MTKRTLVTLERGEDHPALVGRVVVLEQISSHVLRLRQAGLANIGARP